MKKLLLAHLAILLIFGACSAPNKPDGKQRVLVSTGMIGHAVKAILGDVAEVEILMGPGVDPHLYKASQGDMRRISEASILVINGLHLEGKMAETFEHISKSKPVISVGEGIPESSRIPVPGSENLFDPHIWLDVNLWSKGILYAGRRLQEAFPGDSVAIGKRLSAYMDSLSALDEQARQMINQIPESQRILITSHDAFHYFGRAYGVEVKGLQGISTVSEYGLKDVSDMVQFICRRNIQAVFIESSVPTQSIQAVLEGCLAKNHPLQKGGMLYSDAVGPDGSYFSMIRHNVKTIQQALSPPLK